MLIQLFSNRELRSVPDALEQQVVQRINAVRAGCWPTLHWNTMLNELAEHRARYIVDTVQGRRRPSSKLVAMPVQDRLSRIGYDAAAATEVADIYQTQAALVSPDQAIDQQVDGLLADVESRLKLLHPHLRETGVAVLLSSFEQLPAIVTVIISAQPARCRAEGAAAGLDSGQEALWNNVCHIHYPDGRLSGIAV